MNDFNKSLKFFLFLIIVLTLMKNVSAEMELIASDSFESGTYSGGLGWTGNWITTGSTYPWFASHDSGTYSAFLNGQASITRTVDTTGYSNVNISFWVWSVATPISVRYTIDGVETTLLTINTVHGFTRYEFSLPSGVTDIKFNNDGFSSVSYIDDIRIMGDSAPVQTVSVLAQNNYAVNDIASFQLSSSIVSQLHTLEVMYPNGTQICGGNFLSPGIANTMFTFDCQLPSEPIVDAKAFFYLTNDIGVNSTDFFNVIDYQQNNEFLDIKNVYFSRQVLQGSSTEIFALIESVENLTYKRINLLFPNNESRLITLTKTENDNEYRGFITDTFNTGNTTFTIEVRTNNYIDTYTNQYYVAPYSIDFVDTVNYVNQILEATIEVHGTEYVSGDNAKVWVQLLDEVGEDLNDAVCEVSIYYPTGGYFIKEATMINMNSDGIYFFDFIAPSFNGVYPAIAKCYFDIVSNFEYADGFAYTIAKDFEGTYALTTAIDGAEHKFKEVNTAGVRRLDFEYFFTDMCGINTSQDLLSSLSVYVNVKWDSVTNDDITIHLYNYSSSTWIPLSNKILEPNNRVTVTNTIQTNNLTRDGYVNSTGGLRLRFNDSAVADGGDTKIEVDYVAVSCNEFANPLWQSLKGGSEAHISKGPFGDEGLYELELDYGELRNDSYYNGFDIYFTLGSKSSAFVEESKIKIPLFDPFPGHHVTNIEIYNSTNMSWYNVNFSIQYDHSTSKDEVIIYLDLYPFQNYQIRVINENYWKQQMLSDYQNAILLNDFISIACGDYVYSNSLNEYIIPRNGTEYYPNDNFYRSCNNFLSSFYNYNLSMYNSFYQLKSVSINFTSQEMLESESLYIHLIEEAHEILQYGTTILDGLFAADSYSLSLIADPSPPTNPSYVTYFSSISTSYLSYVNMNTRLSEINQTTYQILSNQEQINITLFNINQTINAINLGIVDINSSLQTIISQLNILETEIQNLDYFTSEMVFLITDSIVSTQNSMNADSAIEARAELKVAQSKLQELNVLLNNPIEKENNNIIYIIGSIVLLGIIVIKVSMVSRSKREILDEGETVDIFSDKNKQEVINNE